ncbi:SMP-30/gluconolaconase/LRE-like domain containing protein [Nitzschia inconspicua]|uniref:SMP-30/gluconolaconase/LRE-like domain containing protein n=1 Tax=Nitzschia inconspicua TaxID=303405 RepID=A0A9K3Q6F2_9STRA|nr:SMP-30/gluconolaconase/LRE-like domain containing protein [Nitzschia inconspicua]
MKIHLLLTTAVSVATLLAVVAADTHRALRGGEEDMLHRKLAPAPKVEICHIPPGNPQNSHTITVSQNAVKAHLAHGDTLGPCKEGPCDLKTYTLSEDFNEGSSVNVGSTQVPDQLQLDNSATPFNFIWVAASSRGTVIKVDTNTGDILGEYRTTPSQNGSPSRTTVDSDGSVWVANRAGAGSVVHIGLVENGQCEDRNNNGVIDTSTGLGDIKQWTDLTGTRSVGTAEDECIVSYTLVSSSGTRHVSVNQDNDIWVSGTGGQKWDKVKGGNVNLDPNSGEIIAQYNSVGFGGYGGLIDGNGVIWSSRPLLRWDTAKDLIGANGDPPGPNIGPPTEGLNWAGQNNFDSYGLCVDPYGNVWNTQLSGGLIHKYDPDGQYLGGFEHGNFNAQGCVAGPNGDIWVAHSLASATTVGHLKNDGTFVGNVDLDSGVGPTGVAVDANGKIWSANINSNTLSRIDPSLNGGVGGVDLTVNLGAGAGPYNYSDMTGSTLVAPPNFGTWTVIFDGGVADKVWQGLVWNEITPSDSTLTVQASTSSDGETFGALEAVTKDTPLTATGQYLKVVVSFQRATIGGDPQDTTPILNDLTILC